MRWRIRCRARPARCLCAKTQPLFVLSTAATLPKVLLPTGGDAIDEDEDEEAGIPRVNLLERSPLALADGVFSTTYALLQPCVAGRKSSLEEKEKGEPVHCTQRTILNASCPARARSDVMVDPTADEEDLASSTITVCGSAAKAKTQGRDACHQRHPLSSPHAHSRCRWLRTSRARYTPARFPVRAGVPPPSSFLSCVARSPAFVC